MQSTVCPCCLGMGCRRYSTVVNHTGVVTTQTLRATHTKTIKQQNCAEGVIDGPRFPHMEQASYMHASNHTCMPNACLTHACLTHHTFMLNTSYMHACHITHCMPTISYTHTCHIIHMSTISYTTCLTHHTRMPATSQMHACHIVKQTLQRKIHLCRMYIMLHHAGVVLQGCIAGFV